MRPSYKNPDGYVTGEA